VLANIDCISSVIGLKALDNCCALSGEPQDALLL
jgi:hypothetical protein